MNAKPQIVYSHESVRVLRYLLPPIGVNTYLILQDYILVLVDPGAGIAKILREQDLSKHKANVLLTHCHYDHIAGLEELHSASVWISRQDLPGLSEPERNMAPEFEMVFLSSKGWTVHSLDPGDHQIDGLSFTAFLMPGHTPGSMIFDFGPFLCTGDVIFDSSIGRTDLPYGDPNAMKQSLQSFRALFQDRPRELLVLPGHMDIVPLGILWRQNPYLSDRPLG